MLQFVLWSKLLFCGEKHMHYSPDERMFRNSLSYSGCDTWVVREGYEGLVLGNIEGPRNTDSPLEVPADLSNVAESPVVKNLRFGDGQLLRDGEGDAFVSDDRERTLKGRHIVHVGWDDVKGWLSEV